MRMNTLHQIASFVLLIALFISLLSCSSTKSYSSQEPSMKEMYLAYVISLKTAQTLYKNKDAKFYVDFTDSILQEGYGISQTKVRDITELGSKNNWEEPCEGRMNMFGPCMMGIVNITMKAERKGKFPDFSEIRALAKTLVE